MVAKTLFILFLLHMCGLHYVMIGFRIYHCLKASFRICFLESSPRSRTLESSSRHWRITLPRESCSLCRGLSKRPSRYVDVGVDPARSLKFSIF